MGKAPRNPHGLAVRKDLSDMAHKSTNYRRKTKQYIGIQ